jgi:AcrR family transcriptional regulator
MLELCGELGYDTVTVAAVLERSGANRTWFYETYAGKPDCYARAYAAGAEAFCERLLSACTTAVDPARAMRAALGELDDFIATDPAMATGLLAEVRVAGGAALAKRDEIFERLSRAIEHTHRETGRPRRPPPPASTATFILDAFEAAVIRALRDGGALEGLAAELVGLADAY